MISLITLNSIFYGNTVQEWAISLFIILGAFIVGKVVYWAFGNVIKVVTKRTKNKLDDILVDMIEEPVMFAIILAGAWYAISLLTFSETIFTWIKHIYNVLVVLNVTWFISRFFEAVYENYIVPLAEKTETDFDDQLLPLVRKGVKTIVWILGIIIALDNAGYNVGALLAGLGIGGIAIAMAAKDTISNFFGGITIFTDKPFKVKDRIRISSYDGTVQEIGLRSTRLKTLDGTQVTIPNSMFAESPVENITREPARKIVLLLGLTYDTKPKDMQKAIKILDAIAKKHHESITEDYKIAFTDFGDFSLGIKFIYYIKKSAEILETQSSMNLHILEQFNKSRLSFAFPTQTIELKR